MTELCDRFLVPTEKKAMDCFEQVSVAILQAFPPGSPPRPCPGVWSKGCPAFSRIAMETLLRTRKPELSQDLRLPRHLRGGLCCTAHLTDEETEVQPFKNASQCHLASSSGGRARTGLLSRHSLLFHKMGTTLISLKPQTWGGLGNLLLGPSNSSASPSSQPLIFFYSRMEPDQFSSKLLSAGPWLCDLRQVFNFSGL